VALSITISDMLVMVEGSGLEQRPPLGGLDVRRVIRSLVGIKSAGCRWPRSPHADTQWAADMQTFTHVSMVFKLVAKIGGLAWLTRPHRKMDSLREEIPQGASLPTG
jgi:hypothetical protein